MSATVERGTMARVCAVTDVPVDRGIPALIDGAQLAVFRLAGGEVFVVGQWDPYGGAHVMSRALVGSTLVDGVEVPFIASPLHKQRFDLRTGRALADPEVTLGSYAVQVRDGDLFVGGLVDHPIGAEARS